MNGIFEYTDPIEYLNSVFSKIKANNHRFSLRAWASQMGLPHVTLLSLVLNRKRRLLPPLSTKISQYLQNRDHLTEKEARYFEILVMYAQSRTPEEKEMYQRLLANLRPDRFFTTLELDHIRLISDWYHFAILEMTNLRDFNSDPTWIKKCLADIVTESQIKDAITRLIRLGLLKKTEGGKLKKTTPYLATGNNRPNLDLRKLHEQFLEKAKDALNSQDLSERTITGHMMSIDRASLPEIKKRIDEFRREIGQNFESHQGNAVYQLGIQFFSLTKGVQK